MEPEWAIVVESLGVPFTWQVLFFAALAFLLSAAVFDWRCPRIIHEQRSYGEYDSLGRGDWYLVDYMMEVGAEETLRSGDMMSDWLCWRAGSVAMDRNTQDGGFRWVFREVRYRRRIYDSEGADSDFVACAERAELSPREAFHRLSAAAETHVSAWRATAWVLLWIGIAAYSFVFWQSFAWVLKTL